MIWLLLLRSSKHFWPALPHLELPCSGCLLPNCMLGALWGKARAWFPKESLCSSKKVHSLWKSQAPILEWKVSGCPLSLKVKSYSLVPLIVAERQGSYRELLQTNKMGTHLHTEYMQYIHDISVHMSIHQKPGWRRSEWQAPKTQYVKQSASLVGSLSSRCYNKNTRLDGLSNKHLFLNNSGV